MIRFKVNNDLKSEPVVLGLRVSNIIYLVMIIIVALVFFGMSGYLGINKMYVGILFILILLAAIFFLKRMEKNSDYGYMDKLISRIIQPKEIEPSDMKTILLKRNRNETRRN